MLNTPDSPLGNASDVVVPLAAGKETSVAATKSYVASLSAILQMVACLGRDRELLGLLDTLPEQLERAKALNWSSATDTLNACNDLYVVGRGLGLCAAQEAALKCADGTDLVIMTLRAQSQLSRWVASHVSTQVLHQTTPPVLLIRPTDDWQSTRTRFRRILVALDGSEISEQVLPHVHELGSKFGGHVTLLSVSEGSQDDARKAALGRYLSGVAKQLSAKGVAVSTRVETSAPTQAILDVCAEEHIDLVMMTSHGTGGLERQAAIKLGSVVGNVVQQAPCPAFVVSGQVPTREETAAA